MNDIFKKINFRFKTIKDPISQFHSDHYLRHNARRLEHLSSLRIPVTGKSVLEVGAGIGDHSHYYLDRGCNLTITEARNNNLKILKKRYPETKVQFLDLDKPIFNLSTKFDVVHCYGLLYHLKNPEQAIEFLSNLCNGILILETCVSFGNSMEVNLISENKRNPTQAYYGIGCRPTRPWIFEKLKSLFEYVYIPLTQPNHKEFPIDWTIFKNENNTLSRAVFIGSRFNLENEMLSQSLLLKQRRHE